MSQSIFRFCEVYRPDLLYGLRPLSAPRSPRLSPVGTFSRLRARAAVRCVWALAITPLGALAQEETELQKEAPCSLSISSVRIESVELDGKALEPGWSKAKKVGGFIQQSPDEGLDPTEQTYVRAAHDDKAIYFFIEALDRRPDEISAILTQRDLGSPSDWVEVWLNPQNDSQTGYKFAVNARGVQFDSRLSKGGAQEDVDFHAVWGSSVERSERGWTAELRIPFSELRYDRGAQSWDVQVSRSLARENERSVLCETPKRTTRPLLHMSKVTGLPKLPPSRALNLRPYALLGYELVGRQGEFQPRFGGDLKLSLGGSMSWQATVLPDFGQVEQDPSQLNLTAFEIFQAERRPFFLDGRENLTLPLSYKNFFNEQLYYSRRIGARPHIDFGYDSDQVSDYPQQSRILGASKLIGRTQGGLSYSLLNAVTGRETATFEDENGDFTERTVAAPTSFNIAKLNQEVQNGRGQLGFTGTHVHRFLDGALKEELVQDATTGAADFDLRFGDIGLQGQLVGSHLQGSRTAIDSVQRSPTNNLQRPDAPHLTYDPDATSMSGYGVALGGGIFDGGPWRGFWGGQIRSQGLNTNDLGFLQFSDQQKYEGVVEYRFDEPTRWYRRGDAHVAAWLESTGGPEIVSAGASVHHGFLFRNNTGFWAGTLRRASSLDPRMLRGGPAFLLPEASGYWWGTYSDGRKPWQFMLTGGGDIAEENSLDVHHVTLTGTFRPTSAIGFSVAPSFRTSKNDAQYVDTLSENEGDAYYLGALSSETYSLTLRASWAIALGLTLRVYAMPFVSAGRYAQFYRVTDPRAQRYEDRREVADYSGDDRFLSTELRSSVVLRWDYAPGSSAYAVWTHRQGDWNEQAGSVRASRDVSALLGSEATDVFMLKLDYFL